MSDTDSSRRPRIIYVGGSVRSGTTIVTMLLGANHNAFAAGEIQLIFHLMVKRNYQLKCSCGQLVHECPFWSVVLERFHAALPEISNERAAEITRNVESIPERWRHSHADWEDYRKVWQTMFSAVAETSGASVIVDSSKTGRGALCRPLALASCGFDVSVLHMVRDPRAVAWSILRREISSGRISSSGAQFRAAAYAGLHWNITNLSTSILYRSQRQVAYYAERFEEFEDHPVEFLHDLEKAFGLDLSTSVEIVQNNALIPGGHLSAGNEVRHQPDVHLTKQPPDWKTRLSTPAKLGITLGSPAAYLYHYRVADWR